MFLGAELLQLVVHLAQGIENRVLHVMAQLSRESLHRVVLLGVHKPYMPAAV